MSEHHTSLTFGMEADAYPLKEKIVLRSGVAVFESQLALNPASSPDCIFLSSTIFGTCFSGASDCPIHPFICVPRRPFTNSSTAAEVLAELHISNFQSEHIVSFDATRIPYPGYQPGTKNDEIHTDTGEQYMFAPEGFDNEDTGSADESADLSRASHAALRSYVLNHHLFYILIHDKPKQHGEVMYSDLVLLSAAGVSPFTGHPVGAVTSQVCHNLCD
jgi:hypothetical protein